MTLILRRWGRWTLRALLYVLLAFMCVALAASIYRNDTGTNLRNFADDAFLWSIAAGVAVYFWLAKRFLDRLSYRRNWRPFTRDLFNLAAFIIAVPLVTAPVCILTREALLYFAPSVVP